MRRLQRITRRPWPPQTVRHTGAAAVGHHRAICSAAGRLAGGTKSSSNVGRCRMPRRCSGHRNVQQNSAATSPTSSPRPPRRSACASRCAQTLIVGDDPFFLARKVAASRAWWWSCRRQVTRTDQDDVEFSRSLDFPSSTSIVLMVRCSPLYQLFSAMRPYLSPWRGPAAASAFSYCQSQCHRISKTCLAKNLSGLPTPAEPPAPGEGRLGGG